MRWIARGTSSIIAGLFLFIGIGETIFGREPLTFEGIMVAIVFTSVVISVIIAWWKEKIGGIMLTTAAIALGLLIYFTARRNKIPVILFLAGPLLLSGILFLLSWSKSKVIKPRS